MFNEENQNTIPHLNVGDKSKQTTLTDILVTPKAVEDVLKKLNPGKAQGPDKIPSKLLKELHNF